MSQDIKKRPRDNRHLSAPVLPTTKATHVAASVQQAIQRDPLQAMPGDEAAQRKHPVMQAIDLLINYDGEELFEPDSFNEAGRQLQTYHAEQMGALQQASGRAEESTRQLSELIEDVAEMLGFDLTDRTAGEMLEVLRDRLNPPMPYLDPDSPADFPALAEPLSEAAEKAGSHLHDVCSVLAKHFGDDPAVTFENAAGLVQGIVGDLANLANQFHNERDRADKLLATLQQDSQKVREYVDPNALRQLVSDFGGGLVDNPLEVLREILTNLQKNQMPDGWQAHSQTLIDSNLRYEKVLATMRNVMSLV